MVVGIAGFMGSGKTFAGKYLESLGSEFIEADDVVSLLYQKDGGGYRKIVDYFGDEFLDGKGEIDRKKLAAYAFRTDTHLRVLNGLVHPLIKNFIAGKVKNVDFELVFVEAINFESDGLGDLVDKVLWIEVDEKVIQIRLEDENRFNKSVRGKVLSFQKRVKKADYVINNSGTKDEFRKRLKSLFEELRKELR